MHSPLPPSDTAPNFDPCDLYRDCTLCPRMCHANRYVRTGICGCGPEIRAARAALHFWRSPASAVRMAAALSSSPAVR